MHGEGWKRVEFYITEDKGRVPGSGVYTRFAESRRSSVANEGQTVVKGEVKTESL